MLESTPRNNNYIESSNSSNSNTESHKHHEISPNQPQQHEKNLEVKAVLQKDFDLVCKLLEIATKKPPQVIFQKDFYYKTQDHSRLKFRTEKSILVTVDPNSGQEHSQMSEKTAYVVRYDRLDTAQEKFSYYDRCIINDVSGFKKVFLTGTLEIEAVVKKVRRLWLYKNARIHVDVVDTLDPVYVEIEVVIQNKIQEEDSHELMQTLLDFLEIKTNQKLPFSYRDMVVLQKQKKWLENITG